MRGKREIVLKARQEGLSTLILALIFVDTLSNPGTYSAIAAHDAESTRKLWAIVRRYWQQLPPELRPDERPEYSNRKELVWSSIDSSLFVGTAGTDNFGRGSTCQNVHASEVAVWPDAGKVFDSLMESVPADGNVFVESTANGMGNLFHEMWTRGEAGTDTDAQFSNRFFSWALFEDYRAPVPANWTPTADETALATKHGLTAEQLVWRRRKRSEFALRGRAEVFPQEYPLTPGEAFLATGGKVLSEFIPERAPTGHLVPDFVPPKAWQHYLIIDPGWTRCAALWFAVDPRGMVWLYGEHYVGERLPEDHMIDLQVQWVIFGRPTPRVLMDRSAFDIKRSRTGQELPSDAEEFLEAARKIGPDADWFAPEAAQRKDEFALKVKRYLAHDKIRVCEGLTWWRWEQARWVREPALIGKASLVRTWEGRPIDKDNHLMDCTRYGINDLPDILGPEDAGSVPVDPRRAAITKHWEEELTPDDDDQAY